MSEGLNLALKYASSQSENYMRILCLGSFNVIYIRMCLHDAIRANFVCEWAISSTPKAVGLSLFDELFGTSLQSLQIVNLIFANKPL